MLMENVTAPVAGDQPGWDPSSQLPFDPKVIITLEEQPVFCLPTAHPLHSQLLEVHQESLRADFKLEKKNGGDKIRWKKTELLKL